MASAPTSASAPRGRVVFLAAIGYTYIALVVLVILGGIAACAYGVVTGHALLIKVAIPLAILVFTMARAFAVRIEPPPGIPLSRSEGAELWRLADAARKQLGSPKIDQIVMTDEVNAAVMQVPRFGPFGPSRSYLVAGLPLMQALSPSEFEAVVGHELGHLKAGLEEKFAAEWTRVALPAWHAEHRRIATEREQLARLRELGPDRLGPEQQLELARLTESHAEPAEAAAAWQRLLETMPEEAEAVFRNGEHLLREGDETGLEWLRHAAELDPEAQFAAFVVGADYLSEHGRAAEVDDWMKRLGLEAS